MSNGDKDYVRGSVGDALINDQSGDEHVEELLTVIERFTIKK